MWVCDTLKLLKRVFAHVESNLQAALRESLATCQIYGDCKMLLGHCCRPHIFAARALGSCACQPFSGVSNRTSGFNVAYDVLFSWRVATKCAIDSPSALVCWPPLMCISCKHLDSVSCLPTTMVRKFADRAIEQPIRSFRRWASTYSKQNLESSCWNFMQYPICQVDLVGKCTDAGL